MNQDHSSTLPDTREVPTELSIGETWDSAAVSALIRSKSTLGETPAFLFVGRHEARLLRDHLAAAFGPDSVTSLKDTYYMGLEVIEIDVDTYLRTAGRKVIRTLQDPIARRPAWRDRDSDTLWQLRLGA